MRIISGKYKSRLIDAPKGSNTRPSSSKFRGVVFNICQGIIDDANFLDLFSGAGAMGLEAISRGASSATFVENNRQALRCIQENIKKLQCEDLSRVLPQDVFKAMKGFAKNKEKFDLIFADPPYEKWVHINGEKRLASEWVMYFVHSNSLLQENGILLIEEKKGVDLAVLPQFEREERQYSNTSLHILRPVKRQSNVK